VSRVKEALEGSNTEEMKSATEALTQVWHQAAGKMYQQAQAGGGAQQTQGTANQSEHTEGKRSDKDQAVDADYEVVS
jgi:molecular chaperone DnaK